MFGGSSIQLGRVFGVRIGVDPSWFFVLFLIIWSLSGLYQDLFPGEGTKAFLLATLSALLFFLAVVLHELGHAVAAMRAGIGIVGIDLWLFGGVAKMKRDTDSPGVEFKVAVAGPLVTLLIVLVCGAAGTLVAGSWNAFLDAAFFDAAARPSETAAVLGYLANINLVLLVFNLIPGFPLDGGRIARSIAWKMTGDRAKATRFAARLGRGFAYVIGGFGVYALLRGSLIGGVWGIFIAFFLHQAARAAEVQTNVAARIEGVSVADVMDPEPVSIPALLKLDRAIEEYFLRYGWPWFPVVDGEGRFMGFVGRQAVEDVPEQLRPTWTIDEVTTKDAPGTFRVAMDEPLETLLGSDGLRQLGALMAVDGDGRLKGVVTLDQVRRALSPAT
ncbi:MAG: site-2 protease family protein [Thermoleophilaceae bacterium]|nr:site-2 protease family protein [Thermoleophilaceae bacterium]